MMIYVAVFFLFVVLLILGIKLYLSTIEIADISKRCVFITGCDTGFGHCLACTLDAKGVFVIAGCLTEKGARALEEETSSRLKTVILDVTDKNSVRKAFEFTRELTKDEGLWGVVNNAGVMLTFAPAECTTLEEFEDTFKVNLFGTVSMTLTFLPLLRQSKGRLVNVCSMGANFGYPGMANYVASKAAAKMFTECIRRELMKTGVTAHTIEPGGFQTQILDKSRMLNILLRGYQRAGEEVREFYGGHIAKHILGVVKGVNKITDSNPQKVADAMAHALLAKYPKQRYLVGLDAHLMSRLPGFVFDASISFPEPYGELCPELLEEKTVKS